MSKSSATRSDRIGKLISIVSQVEAALTTISPEGPIIIEGEVPESHKELQDFLDTFPSPDDILDIAGLKPPVLEEEEKGVEKAGFNQSIVDCIQLAIVALSDLEHKATLHMAIPVAKEAHERMLKFKDLEARYSYVPVVIQEAPPLEGVPLTDDEEEAFIPIPDKKGKKKARKAKKVKTAFIVNGPSVVSPPSEAGDIEENPTSSKKIVKDAVAGPGVFPVQSNMLEIVYEPGHSVPTVNGKRIKLSEIADHPAKDIQWLPSTDPTYYVVQTMDQATVALLHQLGHIPSRIKSVLMDKVTEALVGLPKVLSKEQAIEQFGKAAVQRSEVIKYWAVAESHLIKNDFDNKLPFINQWYTRLCQVPESLDPTHAAQIFTRFIKQTKKGDTTSLNKTFYSFLSGNLANWKIGETRSDMYKRCDKSLKCYWGSQALVYKQEFEKTPDGALLVRPKPTTTMQRLNKLKALATEKGWKAYSDIAAEAASLSEEVKATVVEAKVLAEDLPFRQRAKIYWSRVFGIASSKVRSVNFETPLSKVGSAIDNVTFGLFRLITGSDIQKTGNGVVVTSWFHKTTYRWKKAMTSEAPASWYELRSSMRTSKGADFSIEIIDRPWWSKVKSGLSSAVWAIGAPVRWFGDQLNYTINHSTSDTVTEG